MANRYSYITPEIIVKQNLLFRIPLYQRLFAWKEREVRQLMHDLHSHFNRHPQKAYYLGMITVVTHDGRLDLIDGQQRTTVLTLLAIGFIRTLCPGQIREKWNRFYDSSNRVYFSGRSHDREYLGALLSGVNSAYRNPNMEDGLACIEGYLEENFDKDELVTFAEQVYEKLKIFVTELPQHYVENPTSLNEYFEAMNASGKSLEQHEILKVELLKDYSGEDKLTLTKLWNAVSDFDKPLVKLVDSQVDRSEQIRRYIHCIQKCEEGRFHEVVNELFANGADEGNAVTIAMMPVEKHEFDDKTPRDREDAIISFPQFLLMVLSLHLNRDEIARIHPTKLHDAFNTDEYQLPVDKIGDFYRDLLYYRLLMDLYVTRLKYDSSASTHKLISRDVDDRDRAEHAHARLRQYQAMLDVSTEHHIWLLPFLRHISSLGHQPTQMELLECLMEIDMNRTGHSSCPKAEAMDYFSKPRYWMWRLDYAIWEKLITEGKEAFAQGNLKYENFDAEAIRQYEFRTNRSIEHLHPQDESENDKWSSDDIHSFGNLAMISQSFNSQQSNLPVHVKFANLEVQIGNKNLQSLKLYFMYLKAKGSDAEWTTTAKDEHATEMLEILEQSLLKARCPDGAVSPQPRV